MFVVSSGGFNTFNFKFIYIWHMLVCSSKKYFEFIFYRFLSYIPTVLMLLIVVVNLINNSADDWFLWMCRRSYVQFILIYFQFSNIILSIMLLLLYLHIIIQISIVVIFTLYLLYLYAYSIARMRKSTASRQ